MIISKTSEVIEGRMEALPNPDRDVEWKIGVAWFMTMVLLIELGLLAFQVGLWAGGRFL